MFAETMCAKFKKVLQAILNTDTRLRYQELVDADNVDAINAEAEKVGGRLHYEMIKYLPNEKCVKEYLERVKLLR